MDRVIRDPLTVAVTFLTARAALGPHGTSLGAPGSARAALGACLYLTLICLLGLGLTTLLPFGHRPGRPGPGAVPGRAGPGQRAPAERRPAPDA